MMAKFKRVFEIKNYEAEEADRWIVNGRAYESIQIGDKLFVQDPQLDEAGTTFFEVVAIKFAYKDVPIVQRGLAAQLLLEGNGGAILANAKHLYGSLIS